MQNENIKDSVRGFQQKLDSFNAKIQYQQLLAQSLAAEFESLTSEFESLKRLFDASSEKIESTSEKTGASLYKAESTSEKIDASSSKTESSSPDFESTLKKIDASSSETESTSNDSALSSIRELASLIRRSAKELKIYFGQPNIPNRMAEILLALGEKKKLSVTEM